MCYIIQCAICIMSIMYSCNCLVDLKIYIYTCFDDISNTKLKFKVWRDIGL